MAGKSWQPSLSSHKVKGTGTHHTLQTVEKGRKRGINGKGTAWTMSCHTLIIVSKTPEEMPPVHMHNTTIYKHIEFRHMHSCVDTADYKGTQVLFVVNSKLNCI